MKKSGSRNSQCFKPWAFHYRYRSITTLQFIGKSSQITCLHWPLVLLKPALSQNYLNLLKWEIKINKVIFNGGKCKYYAGDYYYMRDLRLPFMWQEHENVTKQQINPTQDTLGKFSVHIKKGNIQPFQEWKKSEEGMKKRNKCGT